MKQHTHMMNLLSLILLSTCLVPAILQAQVSDIVPTSATQINLTFAPVVKKASPAVVNIYATRVVQARGFSPLLNDPVFRHFFGDVLPPSGGGISRIQSSLGSGVIVRSDGIVLSNYHVIKNAAAIKVVLLDGREFEATVVVKDPRSDLVALRLKTDQKDLPFLELRDADELQVGDIVLAFGNPFGFGNTVTMGIVSGLARNQLGVHDFRSLIQTDAAVNPGYSGGPLVTLDGRIVGINTFIVSNTGGSIGIGFTIPSNLAVLVLNAVDQGGVVKRPWAGLEIQTVNADIAKELNLKKSEGVLIKNVYENTPAKKGGLKPKDVILKINNKDVSNESSFRFRIATSSLSKPSIFNILRGHNMMDIEVQLEAAPELEDNKKVELTGRHPLAGATVSGLSPAMADDLGLVYKDGGVVIFSIRPGATASFTGFTSGDVVTKVNGVKIKTVEELEQELNKQRGWNIEVRRGDETTLISIQSW